MACFLQEWPLGSPPVVLACSDQAREGLGRIRHDPGMICQHLWRFLSRQAPLVVVSESMQRLNQIMAGSKLELLDSAVGVKSLGYQWTHRSHVCYETIHFPAVQ